MKALVVYDSVYGNTEKIARSIGAAIADDAGVLRPNEIATSELELIDLLIGGAPTQGGRPTRPIQDFLKAIPGPGTRDLSVAAFDTRVPARWVGIFGYAAGRIARSLEAKGARLVAPPEGFFVTGKEGPLREGELERAARWAQEIAARVT